MRRFALLLLAGGPALVAAPPVGAQGFGVYEHNTCAMGRAGVAAASPCADGSAIFFNPAGLAGLSGMHAIAGVTLIQTGGGFTDDLLARQTLAEVVEPRYEELFHLVRKELRRSGFEELIAAGVVLTGGSAKMEGVIDLAEEVFHMPVRLGIPQYVDGLADVVRNPIYATGVGLLLYGKEALENRAHAAHAKLGLGGMVHKMRSWFQVNF